MNRSFARWRLLRVSGLLCAAFLALLVSAQPVRATSWAEIQPARSTESQIFTWFGAPTEVIATFPWRAWVAHPSTPLTTKSYTFRYRSGISDSSLLNGPGGPADSAIVLISNGFVVHVEWQYDGPSARAAAQVLRSDPELKFSAETPPCHAWKHLSDGRVFAEIGEENLEVRIIYDLK